MSKNGHAIFVLYDAHGEESVSPCPRHEASEDQAKSPSGGSCRVGLTSVDQAACKVQTVLEPVSTGLAGSEQPAKDGVWLMRKSERGPHGRTPGGPGRECV